MHHSFFLYGVYDENQKCHSRFKNFIIQSQKGYVRGSLQLLTCGMGLLDPVGDTLIPGHFVELETPESYLSILDALCGFDPLSTKKSFVLRRQLPVYLAEAQPVEAQAYCFNSEKKTASARVLIGDDLQKHLEGPSTDLLNKLSERQKTYIQKLAQAKGREIVPVDMALYRELMSLELIVDKGRRLALSRLGTELSWFL